MADMRSARNWILGVVLTVVVGALAEARNQLVSDAVKWGFGSIGSVWRWLGAPHAVPGWFLTLLIVGGLVLIVAIVAAIYLAVAGSEKPRPQFNFLPLDGIRWQWQWYSDDEISDPQPHCIACRHVLLNRYDTFPFPGKGFDYGTEFFCENCNRQATTPFEGSFREAQMRVHRHVGRMVETGEWKAVVHSESAS